MTDGKPVGAPTEIVIATGNQGKLREIRQILADMPVIVRSLDEFEGIPEIVEDADTFAGNAEKKAREIHRHTGLVAVADDSGLCVDAIDGAPGVYSARYAGDDATDADNNRKLLAAIEDVPDEKRTARFVCNVCVYPVAGRAVHRMGEAPGVILRAPRGENGFGYDPLFYDREHGMTFAELPAETKNRISHRARALAGLPDVLALLAESK